MPPKVSVNICCYNSERFIKETIESVLAQAFGDFEVVIINDGSTDSTEEIINRFTDRRIRYFYQDNKGLSAARNTAISLSKGDYIALLDHDDVWDAEKLELQVKFLEENPSVGVLFSDGYLVDENNRVSGRFFKTRRPYRGDVLKNLIDEYCIVCSTVIARRSLLSGKDLFRVDLEIAEEYDLFLRLASVTKFDYIDKPLARYRLHPQNRSRDTGKLFQEESAILSDLIGKTEGHDLKARISGRLASIRAEMAVICLADKKSLFSKIEIRQALKVASDKPFIFLIYLCTYVPQGLGQKSAWILKKARSLFKRMVFAA